MNGGPNTDATLGKDELGSFGLFALQYPGLDEGLAPMHEHLAALMPLIEVGIGSVERLEVDMPIELDVLRKSDGALSLGSSPPLYYQTTGYPSAVHRLRVTIEADVRTDPGPRPLS